ncbi:MAG: DUF1559 domain-containing protein [Planctomycetes bacterium]|nr:DUF1559 domain-containing protein [Planctomycetota bacterium]
MQRRSTPEGFTLIELLVVIAIIATLIALLLPAVQAAREAARKTQCRNRLKQIGLALHNYEDTHRVFPPGYIYQWTSQGNRCGFGWGTMILPFLEQGPFYDQFDFSRPIWHPAHQELVQRRLSVYLCPTDPITEHVFVEMGTPAVERYAASNYVANFGSPDLDAAPDQSNGVFSRNSATRVRDVRDGLSNTLFIGERVNGVRSRSGTGHRPIRNHGKGNLVYHTGTGGHVHFETIWAGAVRDLNDPTDDHGHMTLFQTGHTPNSPQTDDRDITAPHSGLALFLMGDGSVQGISTSIDFAVYQALGTRAGGEAVPAF